MEGYCGNDSEKIRLKKTGSTRSSRDRSSAIDHVGSGHLGIKHLGIKHLGISHYGIKHPEIGHPSSVGQDGDAHAQVFCRHVKGAVFLLGKKTQRNSRKDCRQLVRSTRR